MPMFTRDVDVGGFCTLNIHYIHKKSSVGNAIALFFCHGCKFKFRHAIYASIECRARRFCEVRKLFPLLTASSTEHSSFRVELSVCLDTGFLRLLASKVL
ncbi:hypothetical protein BDN67DRAFT_820673 [Paxillus ammoniavirescens]|nr:hypothetical protein BDN67DRAFT_820673 [Paxillus ammoniavirescens]